MLRTHVPLPARSNPEVAIRAASVLAVEALRIEVERLRAGEERISSVLLDFFLWDLAKRVEGDAESYEKVELLPAHRTRSIWY